MSAIESKVVVIMGVSSGIGEATARRLAKEGAKLILAARREDRLKELVASLPGEAFYQVADVTKQMDVEKVMKFAVEKFGKIDVLYNNAGIMPQGFLSEADYASWQSMLDINIMGVLHGIGSVLPIMRKQGSGLIITTDSVAGHVVYPGSAVYNGTKYAVRAIMEGLRQEEKNNGIRSTIVSPGMVSTELISTVGNEKIAASLTEMGKKEGASLFAEDVANAVAYVIEQPEHVAVSEVLIRPSRQIV
ncbi:SDR family oxidoreductase [Enterococcus sp. LJL120]